MSKTLLTAAACGVLMFVAAGAANAADRGFCRDYARAAMTQVRIAQEHPRCDWRMDKDPARWGTDVHAHFDWCLNSSRDQADAERDARRHMLDHCAR